MDENGSVSGENYGSIHQEDAGYFAAFDTALSSGTLGDTSTVTFDTVTSVDGDTQNGSAIWYLSASGAVPDGLNIMLEPAACDGLAARVYGDEAGAGQ